MAFVDFSESTSNERSYYKEQLMLFGEISLNSGDEVCIFPITNKTMSDSKPLFRSRPFPKADIIKNPLIYNQEKEKFIDEFRTQLNVACKKLDQFPPSPHTDLFSIFTVASDVFPNGKKKNLIIFSDMIEDSIIRGKRYNFERDQINDDYCLKLINVLKKENMVPNLTGISMYICGAKSPDKAIYDEQYRSIRRFWELYAKQTGATLRYESSIQNIFGYTSDMNYE